MKQSILLVLVLGTFIRPAAQPLEPCQLPNVLLDTIIHHNKGKSRLSAYKGKPLVLLFWFRQCSNCLQQLKKADSLQREFGKQVTFLGVTRDGLADTKRFFSNHKLLASSRLQSVVSDTVLYKFFPHRTEPHLVWLNKKLEVLAITEARYLTREHVAMLAAGRLPQLPRKQETEDSRLFYSMDPLILNNYNENKGRMLRYSMVSEYMPGVSNRAGFYSEDSGSMRLTVINKSLPFLYSYAAGLSRLHERLMHFEDAAAFAVNPYTKENLFCYDATLKGGTRESMLQLMQRDLAGYFGMESQVEERMEECLVIQVADSSFLHQPLQNLQDYLMMQKRNDVEQHTATTTALAQNLFTRLELPLLDETGLKGHLTLFLPTDRTDEALLQQCLEMRGLKLVRAKRLMKVLIVRRAI